MHSEHVAHVGLVFLFLIVGAILVVIGHSVVGVTLISFSCFGWLVFVGMLVQDGRARTEQTTTEQNARI